MGGSSFTTVLCDTNSNEACVNINQCSNEGNTTVWRFTDNTLIKTQVQYSCGWDMLYILQILLEKILLEFVSGTQKLEMINFAANLSQIVLTIRIDLSMRSKRNTGIFWVLDLFVIPFKQLWWMEIIILIIFDDVLISDIWRDYECEDYHEACKTFVKITPESCTTTHSAYPFMRVVCMESCRRCESKVCI